MGIWIAVTLALVLFSTGVIWNIQEKNRERELADISDALNDILNDKKLEISLSGTSKEILPSKIYHQLCRLQSITEGYHTKIENDRDSIKRLITEIAHQLRTPLTNIETYLDFLKEEESREKQMRYLEAVEASERKVHFLTESFIKMSRLENRVIQIRMEDTDLLLSLEGAVLQADRKAKERNLAIQTRFPERLSYRHDSNWLTEAVYNLLDNAVKYSEAGQEILIGAEKNEMFVRIWVRDYGAGIDSEEEAKVFQRFYRGKNAAKKEGFGIGLYLTREIVLLHHGFVRLRGEERGTLAEIYLSLLEDC